MGFQALEDFFGVFELAFPDGEDTPALFSQFADMFFVVGDVALEFLPPEFFVGFRHAGDFAAFMAMPEAAVDEDDGLVLSEDNIGFSGQILPVQAEPVAGAME